MKKQIFLTLMLLLALISGCTKVDPVVASEKITVYKSQSCGCCGIYVNYLKKAGFSVEVKDVLDVAEIKNQNKIPRELSSCHTSIVGKYFVEGHVPYEAIVKLVTEKPDIAGIALPGMPSGSPGMPGAKRGDFVIYSIGKDGTTGEFMRI